MSAATEPRDPGGPAPDPPAGPRTAAFLSLADRGRYLFGAVLALVILSVPVALLTQPGGAALPLVVAVLATGALAILAAPVVAERRGRAACDDDEESA